MSANSWYSFEKVRDYQIVNLYDATSRKYRTIYYTNMRTVATDYNEIAYYTYDTDSIEYQKIEYLGNIICTRTKVDTVITDKQKIFNATGYYADGRYYHYVKNHLGSICLVIDSETDNVIQNTSYSASGVPSSTNLDVQPYLYNGKEFIEAYGLNEYDSQARMYYAPIMRTTTMDPHAENNYHQSPYSWCGNNPINAIDPTGMDSVSVAYNTETNKWDIGNPIISKGDDVISVTGKDGNTTDYTFSEGEYGKRVNMLNLENTGDGKDGYVLGVYHVSGAEEGGTGFYVTPGGEASNVEESGRRIIEDTYPIVAPFNESRWLFPGVGGSDVEARGARFHWGKGYAKDWTDGCFVLFTNYTLVNGKIHITEDNSKTAAINFARLLGGVGTANSTYKGRLGVLCYPYGIQDRLVLKSIWKR